MIRMVIWGLLIYIGYRIVKGMMGRREIRTGANSQPDEAVVTHRDPVCGIYVSENDAVIGRLNNERHYFCSAECLERFRQELEQKTT